MLEMFSQLHRNTLSYIADAQKELSARASEPAESNSHSQSKEEFGGLEKLCKMMHKEFQMLQEERIARQKESQKMMQLFRENTNKLEEILDEMKKFNHADLVKRLECLTDNTRQEYLQMGDKAKEAQNAATTYYYEAGSAIITEMKKLCKEQMDALNNVVQETMTRLNSVSGNQPMKDSSVCHNLHQLCPFFRMSLKNASFTKPCTFQLMRTQKRLIFFKQINSQFFQKFRKPNVNRVSNVFVRCVYCGDFRHSPVDCQ